MKPLPAARLLARLRILRAALLATLARAAGAELATGVRIGPGCDLIPGLDLARRGTIHLGPDCELVRDVVLHSYGGSITLGARVHLGPGVVVYGHGGVEIGDDCIVAMHCRILSSEHALPRLDRRIRWEPDLLKATRLGVDVWLGAGVTVLGGVTLGDGCVVGAGAVVTRDIPPGAIAVGVPARVVGRRPPAPASPP